MPMNQSSNLPPTLYSSIISSLFSSPTPLFSPINQSFNALKLPQKSHKTNSKMANLSSYLTKSLLFLLYIGCFFFTSSNPNTHTHLRKKRKSSTHKVISSSWSFFKRIFSSKPTPKTQRSTPFPPSSPRSSQHSVTPIIPPDTLISDPPRKKRSGSRSEFESLSENPFFPLRNDIFPCPVCGEIFQKGQLLEQHQAVKHAVSELQEGDSGKNIVWMIFKTGWPDKNRSPRIDRILKIHNSAKILSRFEEYREIVKAKAARNGAVLRRDERCIADGNELLRFHCTTFVCNLGQKGNSSLCNQQYCSVCGIIRSGFSPKLDGISTLSSSWKAHVAVPDDMEAEFAFMNVKRAMLVCRVIAGRVGCDPMVVDKEDPGFDSLVGQTEASRGKLDEDELLVFNSKAVLPCFVIVYSV